jgi:hypothetical protein
VFRVGCRVGSGFRAGTAVLVPPPSLRVCAVLWCAAWAVCAPPRVQKYALAKDEDMRRRKEFVESKRDEAERAATHMRETVCAPFFRAGRLLGCAVAGVVGVAGCVCDCVCVM